MIENEVEVSPIVLVQEDIVDSAPVQESDVEKAKQDLTVNVLGPKTFRGNDGATRCCKNFHLQITWLSPGQRWLLDQVGHVVDTLYMNN